MKKFMIGLFALATMGCMLSPTQESLSVSAQNTYTTDKQPSSRIAVGENAMAVEGDTPLIVASRQGNLQAVQTLLATGADVNAANTKGTTPLMAAGEAGHADVIKVLGGNKQLDLETMDWNMDTALMLAVRNQQADAVKALIDLGANVNFMKAGMSVLIAASYQGNVEIVKALLDGGADTAWADENGDTALDVALATNHPQIAALLQQYSRR